MNHDSEIDFPGSFPGSDSSVPCRSVWYILAHEMLFFSYVDALLAAGLYGLYVAVFSIAMGAASASSTVVPRKIRAAMWATGWTRFCITTFTTAPLVAFVTDMALYMIASECRLSTSSRANLDLAIQVVYTISLLAAPTVGLLSEGTLAWRCYIIWGRKQWLKWVLIVVLILGAGIGITAGGLKSPLINMFPSEESWRISNVVYARLVLAWPWLVFALNTALTYSIVLKIWISTRYIRSSSVSYAAQIIVESAMVTWVATLIYAIASTRTRSTIQTSFMGSSGSIWISAMETGLNLRDSVRAQLPLVFAMSQSLIVARIGIMRFKNAGQAATTMVGFTTSAHNEDFEERN